ncbi:MAG TPA: RsmG family class I SAM-dependent methyltransferase [Solirubrobacteraceae bacterium]|nr:RsmG family class I SAM-dependent methyltransferase [Solirubrobacteraceae bacterium]
MEAIIAALAGGYAPSAIEGRREISLRHVQDSLAALEVADLHGAGLIADLGSGAGFPGIPIAVALPRSRVMLLESRAVRCRFLERLVRLAQVDNASALCVRAESWKEGIGCCDVVLARALAPQPVVLEYAAPLLALGGVLIDWRGPGAIAAAPSAKAAALLGLARRERVHYRTDSAGLNRYLDVFEKVAPTPARFPRRPGLARKRPLGADAKADGGAAR